MTSDVVPPSRDEAIEEPAAPRRGRAWRFLRRTSLLILILGVGWIAGIKTQERGELDHIASIASTWIGKVHTSLAGYKRGLLEQEG